MKNDIELIPLKEEHIEIIRNWRNSEDVSQYMYSDEFITPSMQKKMVSENKFRPNFQVLDYFV